MVLIFPSDSLRMNETRKVDPVRIQPVRLLTIGHSTRSTQEFLQIVKAHRVGLLVDVRTVPRSRRNPQFNRETLAATLKEAGFEYRHCPELGGLRRPKVDSTQLGWTNLSFRGFADYMQTDEFFNALTRFLDLGNGQTVALMCAEAVPWCCHRRLIADALMARGLTVEHILGLSRVQPHTWTQGAQVEGEKVSYPGEQRILF
jgi:uncharacterized protein (DUF488 family)